MVKPMPIWVDVTIPVTKDEMNRLVSSGPCKEYNKACFNCRAWRQFNRTGKVTLTVERTSLLED
jgi:hypothetical protein